MRHRARPSCPLDNSGPASGVAADGLDLGERRPGSGHATSRLADRQPGRGTAPELAVLCGSLMAHSPPAASAYSAICVPADHWGSSETLTPRSELRPAQALGATGWHCRVKKARPPWRAELRRFSGSGRCHPSCRPWCTRKSASCSRVLALLQVAAAVFAANRVVWIQGHEAPWTCGIGGTVMSSWGSVYSWCGCREPGSGRRLGAQCPQRGRAGHGSWYLSLELPAGPDGRRRRIRRGGFPTRTVAEQALARLRMPAPGRVGRLPLTVGQWLDRWLAAGPRRGHRRCGVMPHTCACTWPRTLGRSCWQTCRPRMCRQCSPRSPASTRRRVRR